MASKNDDVKIPENPETVASENPEAAVSAEPQDNGVEVFIQRGNQNDDPNLFVGVNGKSYLIPKGKRVLVPPKVADEINRANAARNKQDENISEMLERKQN